MNPTSVTNYFTLEAAVWEFPWSSVPTIELKGAVISFSRQRLVDFSSCFVSLVHVNARDLVAENINLIKDGLESQINEYLIPKYNERTTR